MGPSLHCPVSNVTVSVIVNLIEARCKIDVQTENGCTPLFIDTQNGCRLGRRLGKDNLRRTDVQRIRGETTDEQISTDLDCIKNRLWGVQSVNLF